ncbi:phage tail protein [Halomonas piscis]|uniref:phage tail protein n=1 Tax=Halomonas piscis TaxID=3031727 RepID=UPI0028A0A277|nr:phage tail protein [Halomonas piscis]
MLEYDIRDLKALRETFDPKVVNKALKWSVNASARKAATRISKETRQRYDIKAGDIKRRLRIERVERDAGRALLYTGTRLPLVQFKPKEKWVSVTPKRRVKSGPRKGSMARRRGVTVRVRKDKGRQLVQGGWLAKGQIFRRADKDDNKSRPIPRFGPSIPEMVDNPEVMREAQDLVRRDLPEQFSGRMQYLLSKQAGLT